MKTSPLAKASASSSSAVSPTYPSPKSMNIPPLPLREGANGGPGLSPTSSRTLQPPHAIRRESFHYAGERPHPPPLRTAYSYVGSSTTSSFMLKTGANAEKREWETQAKRDAPAEEKPTEKEELTTKGRKRKRLAKACSACHKNKRRCDGFAPCSNCEFSNRPCLYLNAQGDPIPPPRTRDSSIAPARASKDDGNTKGSSSTHERKTSGESNWSRRDSIKDVDGEPSSRRVTISPAQMVEADPSLSAELIDIFFKRCAPLSTMFHPATFQYRLYLNQTSPILLDTIYALAARLCDNPSLLTTYPPQQPPHLRGEPFIHRAHAAAHRMIEMRKTWTEEERRSDRGTWQETELVQAAYLLSVYFTCLRQPKLGLFYLDAGIDILRPNPSAYIPPPATQLGLSPIEFNTLMETRTRTFWLLAFHDLCAAANGRPRSLVESDLGSIPLPGTEVHWARWGGNAAGGREPGRRDGIIQGSGNWSGEEGQIGELGHVIRILSVFADIMALATDPKSAETKHGLASRLESSLKSWAMSLPRHLHFDEHNLSAAVTKLSSPVPEVKMTGWLYAYMHAVAECGMFYLQAAVAQQTDATYTAQRQSQAVDNLTVIMDSIGRSGREGCCFLFPLFVVSNWQEHLKQSNLIVPGPQQAVMEDRLSLWWNEMKLEWGSDRQELLARGFYSLGHSNPIAQSMPTPRFSQSSSSIELPSSGLGLSLYQTSPVRQMTETASAVSATSPVSTMSVSTPHMSSYPRFSVPTLPPLRPRAQSSAASMGRPYNARSPSPPLSSNRGLPSMSSISASDRSEPISLPPLSSELQTKYREPSLHLASPRHHPYAGGRDRLKSPRLSWAGPATAAIFKEADRERDREYERERERARERERDGQREPLLGIAALVSAAEKERERERRKTMTAV
ncbi:hypothetical protein I317_07464 [Kwoniella heveanensis CBS 569]|nr:hypothetical protein I317_07464 [Kwoniella heveanensis CBS 569]